MYLKKTLESENSLNSLDWVLKYLTMSFEYGARAT